MSLFHKKSLARYSFENEVDASIVRVFVNTRSRTKEYIRPNTTIENEIEISVKFFEEVLEIKDILVFTDFSRREIIE